MEFQPLKYRFLPTTDNPDSAYTLLLFHGTGGDENDLIPLAQQHFQRNYNILSVRGNVDENGMPRFFRRLSMGVFDEEDVIFRANEIVHFLKGQAPTLGFDPRKLIAFGFSNGANIAGAILMLHPDFLAGAVLVRPMVPLQNLKEFKGNQSTKVLFLAAQQDTMTTLASSKNYAALLKENNFKVSDHYWQAGHHLIQDDLTTTQKWLESNF